MLSRWHRTKSAAERLNVSEQNLVVHRMRGTGPVYSKVGRICLYDEADLDAWVRTQRVEMKPVKSSAISEREAA